jgi:hypothetical protein
MAASAKFYVSVNGGANQEGGVEVPSGAVIDFVPASTVGWLRQRWEFVDYPEGWATPAGWSLAADGTIYSTDVDPTNVTLPASSVLWGKWMLRLRVNEQIDTDQEVIEGLIDETTALSMLSPAGLRDGGARETSQFCTATTLAKQWARDYQRNLRKLEQRSEIATCLAANAATTSNVASNTNLAVAMGANEVWEVEVEMTLSCSGAGGVKFAVSLPAGATIEGGVLGHSTGFTAMTGARINASATLTTNAFCTVAGTLRARAQYRIKNGSTAGSATFQFASGTNLQTSTILAGATHLARRLTEV